MANEQDIRYGSTCSLCSQKLKFTEKGYIHKLSDGTLCRKCNLTLLQLLAEKGSWVDTEEYSCAIRGNYHYKDEHTIPLKEAQALIALRDKVAGRFLDSVGLNGGSVFVVQQVFNLPPKPPGFIFRVRKVRNKVALQGFTLKGEVKQGDTITLRMGGALRRFAALEVIPTENNALTKDVFFNQLSTNIHNHKITDNGEEGWIIIDTENLQGIDRRTFAAACE